MEQDLGGAGDDGGGDGFRASGDPVDDDGGTLDGRALGGDLDAAGEGAGARSNRSGVSVCRVRRTSPCARSPGSTWISMPAAGWTGSSLRARPAPSRQRRHRRRRHPASEDTARGGPTSSVWVAIGSGPSGSPPCAAIIRRHTSIARPSPSAAATSGLRGRRPRASPRRGRRQLDDVGGSAPGEHLDRLADLEGVADAAERRGHVGEEGDGVDAGVGAEVDHRRASSVRPHGSS